MASRFGDVLRPGLAAAKNALTSGSRAKCLAGSFLSYLTKTAGLRVRLTAALRSNLPAFVYSFRTSENSHRAGTSASPRYSSPRILDIVGTTTVVIDLRMEKIDLSTELPD